MTVGEYGNADLVLRVRTDVALSKQIGRAVVLAGAPRYLRSAPRVWITAGNCQETLGYFELAGRPRVAAGTLSFAGKTNPHRSNAVWLDVKPGTLRELRRPISYETRAGHPVMPGAFVYARTERGKVLVLLNPEARPPRRESITTRLVGEGKRRPLQYDEIPTREPIRRGVEVNLIESYKSILGPASRWSHWVFAVDNGTAMANDLWDKELGVLFEAKGSADRAAVRMAIGQLLDQRHALAKFSAASRPPIVDQRRTAPLLAVLLPRRPDADVLSLLGAVRIGCVWKDGRSFDDNAGGLFTQVGHPTRQTYRTSRWRGP